jgi:hypothetical protein
VVLEKAAIKDISSDFEDRKAVCWLVIQNIIFLFKYLRTMLCDNGDDTVKCDEQMGMGGVTRILLWLDIGTFSATEVTFCGICRPQFDTSDMDVIKVFQKFFGIVLTQHTAEQTKKYAQR